MDYSKLSDFEINKRVLTLKSEIKPLEYPHAADGRSAGIVEVNGHYHWFDFCNNPAKAWPIIVANRIALSPYGSDAVFWEAEDKYCTGKSECDNNPLRAAMIVFLMMQGE